MLQQDSMRFMHGMINANKGDFRAVVLLGNARPGPQQDAFFKGVLDLVDKSVIDVPVAYIHANPGSGNVEEYIPFEGHGKLLGVQIENGGRSPPLRINVGFGNRPFLVG
jgi:hypothetical protein